MATALLLTKYLFIYIVAFMSITRSNLINLNMLSVPKGSSQLNIDKLSKDSFSFVALKPDAIQRNLIGEILSRFERKGLRLCGIKLIFPTKQQLNEHYHDLTKAPFFPDIVEFFTSGPIIATVWTGDNAVNICRKLVGKTHPEDAEPGTIRGDYCIGRGRNLVHASDCHENAIREIKIWFQHHELIQYDKTLDSWMYSK